MSVDTEKPGSTMLSVLPSPSIQMARGLQGQVNVDELADMSAFDLFQIQLSSGNTEAAIDAMKRLGVVCQAVGAVETHTQVMPYLTQLVLQPPGGGGGGGAVPSSPTQNAAPGAATTLSDELLLILGQQLLTVASVVPDQPELFLPLLERLAAVEETVVRDQAVTALATLCDSCTDKIKRDNNVAGEENRDIVAPWMALVKRLASADWFTAKVSACGVVAPVYKLVNATIAVSNNGTDPATVTSDTALANIPSHAASQQYELLNLYKELCADETPMVRRAAAKHYGHVLKQAGWLQKNDFASTVIGQLVRDEQDSVRLLAVASLADAGPVFGKANAQWTIQHWLPIVKDGSTDLSWRVRNNLAKHFSDVAGSLGIQHDRRYHAEQSLVMACFVAMLTDAEAEVRAAAVTHLARMVAWGGPAHFATHLQPLLPALADDVVMEVRSKCALALMDAAHGGTLEDNVILQAFGPLLESFLQDEFHEVQLQVLGNLHKIAHLLPGLSGVVSALLQMSKATNWRVREAVAKLLPHLAEARGLDFFSTVLLEPAWLTLLLDPVASVRFSIVRGMSLLTSVAGQEWMVSNLLPHHVRIYNANGNTYLVRNTILKAHIQSALQCNSGPLWNEVVLQIVQRGLTDKVPNVRMVAAKGLSQIVIQGDPAMVQAQIRPALEKRIQEEDDVDVKDACQLALDKLN